MIALLAAKTAHTADSAKPVLRTVFWDFSRNSVIEESGIVFITASSAVGTSRRLLSFTYRMPRMANARLQDPKGVFISEIRRTAAVRKDNDLGSVFPPPRPSGSPSPSS